MLQGRFATKQPEARYPTLWNGLVAAFAPCITGPTGLRLINFGRGGDGMLTNMDAPTDWVRSQGQYCLDFDGSNDQVVCGALNQSGWTSTSISFWIQWTGARSGIDPIAGISQSTGSRYTFLAAFYSAASTGLGYDTLSLYATASNGTQTIKRANVSGWVTGNWYHVTICMKFPSSVSIYVNGIDQTLTTDSTSTGTSIRTGGVFGLSYDAGDSTRVLDGKLDDVRFYNRILSAAEIRILSRSRGIAYTPKQKQYQPHNFAAVAATMSRLLALRRKAALQCY